MSYYLKVYNKCVLTGFPLIIIINIIFSCRNHLKLIFSNIVFFCNCFAVTELNGERDHLAEKYENARTELLHLQGRVSTLAEDLSRMKTEDNNKIPIAVHTSAVNECRRYSLNYIYL